MNLPSVGEEGAVWVAPDGSKYRVQNGAWVFIGKGKAKPKDGDKTPTGGTPSYTPAPKANTKKPAGINFNDAAEIYRRLGIPVNAKFINSWKNKVNSLYEFRDMLRWRDKTYRKSEEYKGSLRKLSGVMAALFPGQKVGMGKLLDTAARKGWDSETLFAKVQGRSIFKNKYAGYKQFLASQPGAAMSPVASAMEYQKYATAQANIYKSLGMAPPPKVVRKAYFSNAASLEQAKQLADPEVLRNLGGAAQAMYGGAPQANQKQLYEKLRKAVMTQKSYLSNQSQGFQLQQNQSGQLTNPYLSD